MTDSVDGKFSQIFALRKIFASVAVSCLLNSSVADVWLKLNIRIQGKFAFHFVLKQVWERKRLGDVNGMWQFSVCRILWRIWTNDRLYMCALSQIILSRCSYLEDVEGFKEGGDRRTPAGIHQDSQSQSTNFLPVWQIKVTCFMKNG